MKPLRSIPVLLIAASCGAQPAQDPVVRLLIDKNLNQRLAEIVGINTDTITIRGMDGEDFVINTDELAALAPATKWHDQTEDPTLQTRGSIATRLGTITLTDGQRLTGSPSVITVDDEIVAWSHSGLGIVGVPIEVVRHISMPRSTAVGNIPPSLTPDIDDVVLMTNGDTLRGFVNSIGIDTSVELTSGTVIEAETSRIDQIMLANEPAEPIGTHVWIADGSVLAIDQLETERAREKSIVLSILRDRPIAPALGRSVPSEADETAFGLATSFGLAELRAANFDSRALVPIVSLESESTGRELVAHTEGFAALGCVDLFMPGPMQTTWQLPRGAERLALTAALPIKARAFGNLELTVRTDGNEVSRHTINADTPVVRLNIDLQGEQTFSLEITEGEFGPIQDQLIVSQGLVFIGD
ncbi:MAG: hypothetical protein ACIARQ_02410 [Phycisphaerales bacterium JB061]